MKFIAGVLAGIILAGMVFILTLPNCPTEDSCEPSFQKHSRLFGIVDYGYWTGKEVTP